MSQDTALQFAQAVSQSAELQKGMHGLDLDQQADRESFLDLAAKAGYMLTFDDWAAVIQRACAPMGKASTQVSMMTPVNPPGCACFVVHGLTYCICL